MTRHLIGLDFETSGLDPARHAPIQLGISFEPEDTFESLIGGWHWDSAYVGLERNCREWSEEAQNVHNIGMEALKPAPLVATVDEMAADFIYDRIGNTHPSNVRLVGWNVGSFDYQWLTRFFPRTAALVSYRSVDLSALTTFTADAYDLPEDALKASVNLKAQTVLSMGGFMPQWHDAAYDAMAALEVYKALKDMLLEDIDRG